MPPVDGYSLLPPEVRAWFDRTLRERGFGDYEAITQQLAEMLHTAGWTAPPSVSTVGRWGQRRKAAMAATLRVSEILSSIHDAAPDEGAKRTSGLSALIQDRIVNLLFELEESSAAADDGDPAAKLDTGHLLAKLASAISQMQRADIAQRKWQSDTERAAVTAAADRAEQVAATRGVSPDGIAALRQAIMGAL